MLNWRAAVHDDRSALQGFRCTEDAQGRRKGLSKLAPMHPRRWELVVQGAIRNLRPPARHPLYIEIAEDAQRTLVGVCCYERTGLGEYFIQSLGIRQESQGQGVGKLMLHRVTEDILGLAGESQQPEAFLWANVHERNVPSQRMLMSLGWQRIIESPRRELFGHERWFLRALTPYEQPELQL